MQFTKFVSIVAFLGLAAADNTINLWKDDACTVPLPAELDLPATGCTTIALPGAGSVDAAITNPNCIATILGFTSEDCAGAGTIVSSPKFTGCTTQGNHNYLSFQVVTPCPA